MEEVVEVFDFRVVVTDFFVGVGADSKGERSR